MTIGKMIRLGVIILILIAEVVLGQSSPAQADTGIASIQPASGTQGTTIIITGTGYTPDEAYSLTFNSIVVATGVVPSTGMINGSFVIPNLPRGSYEVGIITALDDTAYPLPVFTVTPQISIDKNSGSVGDPVILTGNGFDSNSTVTPLFDGMTTDSYATTDVNGTFSGCLLQIPPASQGNHTITADDGYGASPGVSFSVASGLSVSPNTVTCNSTISMTGSGFGASSQLSFYIDDNPTPTPLSATDVRGNFTEETVSVPRIPAGLHTLRVQDGDGNSSQASLTIQPSASISVNAGVPGTSVEISGDGFINDVPIILTYNGKSFTTEQTSLKTEANGSFQGSFSIPSDARGSYPLIISDGTNRLNLDFSIAPAATIDKITGMAGSQITIRGEGFNARGQVIIGYDDLPVANATVDSRGNFYVTVTIGPSSAGQHIITVTEASNNALTRAPTLSETGEAGYIAFPFTVTPTASSAPLNGSVATRVIIQGTGFTSSQNVSLRYDSSEITSTNTDFNGTFTAVFEVPISSGGEHLITVTDGVNTDTFTFIMESDPPPAPSHFSPAGNIKTEPSPGFSWDSVADPSGVTYSFQLARDANFADIVLDEKDLDTPSYQLTKEQFLERRSSKAPYYWRVKATDGASNEGQWSESQSFYVGFTMPTLAYYPIVGVPVLIIGTIAYFIGRRNGRGKISPEG
jgi:hypothetical protein